jgi:hypothetical protein
MRLHSRVNSSACELPFQAQAQLETGQPLGRNLPPVRTHDGKGSNSRDGQRQLHVLVVLLPLH